MKLKIKIKIKQTTAEDTFNLSFETHIKPIINKYIYIYQLVKASRAIRIQYLK